MEMTIRNMSALAALTLVEIVFSVLLLVIAVLGIMLILPTAVQSQQQVRFQLFAAAKAVELSEAIATQDTTMSGVSWSEGNDARTSMAVMDASGRATNAMNDGERLPGVPLQVPVPGARSGGIAVPPAQAYRARPVFGRAGRHDLEQLWSNMDLGAVPLPPQIARRLRSPGDEIGRILDERGTIFYCDPIPMRGHSRVGQQGMQDQNLLVPSELQRVVFAVVGLPQHEALPTHPATTWPYYEMYPFPPQAYDMSSEYTFDLQPDGPDKDNKYDLGAKKKVSARGQPTGYQWTNWNYFAITTDAEFSAAFLKPWQDGQTAFQELARYAWAPLAFRIKHQWTSKKGSTAAIRNYDSQYDPDFPTGSENGHRITDDGYDPAWYDNDVQGTTKPQWHLLMPPFDPADSPGTAGSHPDPVYNGGSFRTGDGSLQWKGQEPDAASNLPPSREMRRYYRRMALRLWFAVTAPEPDLTGYVADALGNVAAPRYETRQMGGNNPLCEQVFPDPTKTDYTDIKAIHPARVLAMSYLAHAAMMVTGYRHPDAGWSDRLNQVDMDASDGTGGDLASDEDRAFARMAHENCMRWVMAWARERPYDTCAPRPANGPTMMDRMLVQFHPFPGGTRIAPNAALFDQMAEPFAPFGYGMPESQRAIAPNESSETANWRALIRGGTATWSGGSSAQAGLLAADDRGAALSSGLTIHQPFAMSERCRQLVFWTADWANYEDAEEIPSAPVEASLYANRASRFVYGRGDHPEGHLMWSDKDRWQRVSQINVQGAQNLRGIIEAKGGIFGADRNGNGRLDRGRIPAGTPMQARPLGRFNLYDPVIRSAVR